MVNGAHTIQYCVVSFIGFTLCITSPPYVYFGKHQSNLLFYTFSFVPRKAKQNLNEMHVTQRIPVIHLFYLTYPYTMKDEGHLYIRTEMHILSHKDLFSSIRTYKCTLTPKYFKWTMQIMCIPEESIFQMIYALNGASCSLVLLGNYVLNYAVSIIEMCKAVHTYIKYSLVLHNHLTLAGVDGSKTLVENFAVQHPYP